MAQFARLTEGTLGRLLPSSCLLCGADAGALPVCAACAADLPRLPHPHCPQCAEPTTLGERCGACLQHPPDFATTRAAYAYAFPLDRLLHALKYHAQLPLAAWAAGEIARLDLPDDIDLIIPSPLHPRRLAERGYNQAAEIARRLGQERALRVDVDHLIRHRHTSAQFDLPLAERQRNVAGAFACQGDLAGAHVLLLDDVMTTGSTARECARVLRLSGARQVTLAILARTLKNAPTGPTH